MVECECYFHSNAQRQIFRFNRYMVECELEFEIKGQNASHSFNRYMVECECKNSYRIGQKHDSVLIDTWWNVNVLLRLHNRLLSLF